MKRKILRKLRELREKAYVSFGKPRIYYLENPVLKLYNLPIVDLAFYKKNSVTNTDIIELIKNKIKS